jgi:hypothetical protein
MEPMVPDEASRALEDDILPLVAEANQLAGRIHPILRGSICNLVRSMNCYYSNLIEGHDTVVRSDRWLRGTVRSGYCRTGAQRWMFDNSLAEIEVRLLGHPPSSILVLN